MIPVTTLEFTIRTSKTFDLGRAPGSSLRGALYGALATMYDTQQDNQNRNDLDSNPVGWLLRLKDNEVSGGQDVARPISIRPPLDVGDSDLTFGISFYGRAYETIPMVISAIPLMGKLGIGRLRTPFDLYDIHYTDPITGKYTLLMDHTGTMVSNLPQPVSSAIYQNLASMMNPTDLKITFLTPTRIISNKKLVNKPIFHIWFQRLLERICTLTNVYTEKDCELPFHDLIQTAKTVKIINDNTNWHEAWSGSRRDGRVKPMGGFIGSVHYQGEIASLLSLVLQGQSLQVGKNTIKGCGWYDIHYQWQT